MKQQTIATVLASLVDAMQRPATLRDATGTVEHANTAFLRLWGNPREKGLPAHLAPVDDTAQTVDDTALDTRCSRAADVVITAGGRPVPVRWETTPAYTHGEPEQLAGIITTVLPLAQYLNLELHYARQIAGSPMDNLWILNEELRILAAQGDRDSLARTSTGALATDLVHGGEVEMLRERLEQARERPGQVIIGQITGQRRTGMRRVIVRIVYRMGEGGTGRYYATTRLLGPLGEQIIERLMLAYDVTTGAALARAMGVSPTIISRKRQADEVPASWIVDCFNRTGASADWLLTGRGAPKREDRE
ncbi:helix-turn-helix domain containing protein [Desulfovibrio mangrovi]|uniref:helix-turn-helix domain-containing protein n=1 Tax=Desulfovibrio mangrovi TaxID=2976983 RepID=UPI002246D259|nr:helix-turn-helix domain-containing protein [Desulfovibrio mangrovi]UZP67700.1 helix-turn-helix domain containing protein [Desulfovibrio mangrovi]